MRKYSKTIGALAAASTLVAGTAMAEIEGEVSVGYANMYEFRFVDLGSDLVTASVDIATEAGPFGLSAGAWYGTWDTPGLPGGGGVNSDELDLYGGISYNITESFALELGYIYYMFPDTSGAFDTQEVYLSATYDFSFGLSLASTVYYDFDAFDGWYWDTSIGYTWDINECLALELGAGVAYADGNDLQAKLSPNPGATKDGFQGWYLSAALPWEFREGVTLTPYIKYTDGDSDLLTNVTNISTGEDHVIAGVSLAVGF
jgi:uncharacterized protein (TIGR02001 family)